MISARPRTRRPQTATDDFSRNNSGRARCQKPLCAAAQAEPKTGHHFIEDQQNARWPEVLAQNSRYPLRQIKAGVVPAPVRGWCRQSARIRPKRCTASRSLKRQLDGVLRERGPARRALSGWQR